MANEERQKKVLTAKQKRKRKMISYSIFFVALLILVVSLMLAFGDLSAMGTTFGEILKGDHWIYLLISVFIVIAYFALYPLPLMFLGKTVDSEATPAETWLIGNSEHFYNGVTPSSVGGQPFQAYAFTNCGVSGAKSTGMILMNYINIVLVSNLFGLISLIYYPRYIAGLENVGGTDLSSLQWIAVLGVILNAVNLVFFVLLGFSKHARRAMVAIMKWVCKWKLLGKHLSKLVPAFDKYLENTQAAAKQIVKHKTRFTMAVAMRFAILFMLYSMPFFLLKAVGMEVSPTDFMVITLGTAFATVCVSFFPTPGGVGAGELVAMVVVASIMVGSMDYDAAKAVSLMWRFISFYLVIFASFVVSAIFEAKIGRNLKVTKEEKDEPPVPAEGAIEEPPSGEPQPEEPKLEEPSPIEEEQKANENDAE